MGLLTSSLIKLIKNDTGTRVLVDDKELTYPSVSICPLLLVSKEDIDITMVENITTERFDKIPSLKELTNISVEFYPSYGK